MSDRGFEGSYAPTVVSEATLSEIRDLSGQPPVQGKHWVMIDLDTGKLKWYQSVKRRFTPKRGRSWGRR